MIRRTSKQSLIIALIGIVVIGIGIIVFMVLLQNKKSPSDSVDVPAVLPSVSSPILPKINIVYGKVIDTNNTLTIEELLPPGEVSGKTFTILTNNDTGFVNQEEVLNKPNDSIEQYKQKESIQNIQKDNYVMLITSNDPSTTSSLTASKILFSKANPFDQNLSGKNSKNDGAKKELQKGLENQYLKKLPNKESSASILKTEEKK